MKTELAYCGLDCKNCQKHLSFDPCSKERLEALRQSMPKPTC